MAITPSQIGSRLRKARGRAGLSQTQVGEKLSVNYVTVSRWERGKQRIRAENLIALSELYGEDLTSLASGKANGAQRVTTAPNRPVGSPSRLSEPRSPAYAALSFTSPIAAQRSRLWLEGFLLELVESKADADFLQRLADGVRAILGGRTKDAERQDPSGVAQGGGTRTTRASGDRG